MRTALRALRRRLLHLRAAIRFQADWKLLAMGVACLIAATFPRPVELPGLTTLPTLTSMPQRILAGAVGLLLVLTGLLLGPGAEAGSSPRRDEADDKDMDVRGRMLLRAQRFWLGDELPAGTGTDRFELRLHRRLDLVDRPLGLDRRDRKPTNPDRPLPVGTSVYTVFEQLDQALLILGPPGGGKTTLLLELLADMLDRAAQDDRTPVPLVFNLSSWKPGTTVARWLVDELHKQYGLPSRTARAWIGDDQVAPLLDGLDEVPAVARARCVAAINEFREEHGLVGIAVCCRIDDYHAAGARLRLTGAIALEELDSRQVAGYLRQAGPPLAGVRAVLRDDPVLVELLRSPLMLHLVASAYRNRSAHQIRSSGDVGQRRDDILGAYVDAMFNRRPPHPRWTAQRLVGWLRWLAKAMLRRGESVFRLEWMQPDLLGSRWRRQLVTVAPAVVGILLVLVLLILPPLGVLGPPPTSRDASALDYWGSVVLFLVPMLLVSFDRGIRPMDRLSWTWGSLRRRFRRSLGWGLAVALVFYAALGLGLWLGEGRPPAISDLRLIGSVTAIVGTLIWLVTALEGRLAEHYDRPNQGMRTSARNALLLGVPPVVLGVLAADGGDAAGIAVWAPFLTLAGLVVGFRVGGRAVVQHAALRALLVSEGSVPLRYIAMLDGAVELVLLRRIGGGYGFLHRLLLEHLAGHTSPATHRHGASATSSTRPSPPSPQ